ncbi:MAG: type II toxin-antitoxin system ParD family antitoxin [Variovorax sp.]|nr:MAG: type II toxin-antitoxin system ParD family antitoxin [Variovorax sp.]
MSTMNISLPETLKEFVDQQVTERGFGTSSEYVRELIRKDKDRAHLRGLLMAGAESPLGAPLDESYFEGLHARIRKGRTASRRRAAR